MKINTLRLRFALWVAALLLAALAVFGAYVYFSMARGLSIAVDEALALNASQVIAGLNIENGQLTLPENLIEPPDNADLRTQTVIRILSLNGQVLQSSGSSSLPLPDPTVASPVFITWIDPASEQSMRIYSAPVTDDNRLLAVVQVARSLEAEHETLQRLLTTLLLGSPLLALFAALGGYFLAARALAPIDAITRAAAHISAADLSARLNLSPNDDEVGRLAATFDDMIARLDDSFRRERQFTADASHELRTPLAAMQAILSVIREHRRTPQEYEQALDDLSEETVRLGSLTQDLLLLAREQKQAAIRHDPVVLSSLLTDVADSLRPLAEAKGLALRVQVPEGLTLTGDMDALIRLFVNLLDNAIKYTERGEITLAARSEADELIVEVTDTGIGIPPEHLPRIFNRFYRVDPARSAGGAGLGLAIARQIAQSHGGRLEVRSAPGAGSTFTIRLPI